MSVYTALYSSESSYIQKGWNSKSVTVPKIAGYDKAWHIGSTLDYVSSIAKCLPVGVLKPKKPCLLTQWGQPRKGRSCQAS